jgi:YD repeat-containing protein
MSYQRKSFGVWLAILFATFVLCSSDNAVAANGSVAYTYDALGRLTMVSYDTGVCIRYTYDPNGNRLSETIIVSATGSTGVWGCFKWGQALWGP